MRVKILLSPIPWIIEPTDSAGQLKILRHQSHSLAMDRTKVRIFEKPHQVVLSGRLHHGDCIRSPSEFLLSLLITNGPQESVKVRSRYQHTRRILHLVNFP